MTSLASLPIAVPMFMELQHILSPSQVPSHTVQSGPCLFISLSLIGFTSTRAAPFPYAHTAGSHNGLHWDGFVFIIGPCFWIPRLTASVPPQMGRDLGFMEIQLVHGRIWPFHVTCFCATSLLVCLVLMKQFFWICYPEAQTHQQCKGLSPWQAISLSGWTLAKPLGKMVALSWAHPVKLPADGLRHLTTWLM